METKKRGVSTTRLTVSLVLAATALSALTLTSFTRSISSFTSSWLSV